MAGDELDRDDLIRGINAVIAKLRATGQPAGIRIIGGAALSLRYFERRTTTDIDARLQPEAPILEAAAEVAKENNWSPEWLNSSAVIFIPTYGADPEWEVLYSSEGVTVEVASPRALLAMKLNASRPGRDVVDIANLLAICNIPDEAAAEELLEQFFPGDGLPDKALKLLVPIFAGGLPEVPPVPPAPWGEVGTLAPVADGSADAALEARLRRFPELRDTKLDPHGISGDERDERESSQLG